jgi:hypothetical protein
MPLPDRYGPTSGAEPPTRLRCDRLAQTSHGYTTMVVLPLITRVSRLSLLVVLLLSLACGLTLAQNAGNAPANAQTSQPTPPTPLSQADLWVKIIGGIVAGVAALVGLPTGILLYKKTQAEIAKLELESAALRTRPESGVEKQDVTAGTYNVHIEGRDNMVQITADPRFLAPLLVLLDFIFAWVVLYLANDLFSLLPFRPLTNLLTILLAFIVLIPIARQVQRVRTLLNPPRTLEEVQESVRQTRIAGYAGYIFVLVVTLLVGLAFLNADNLTKLGHYLAWSLISLASLLVILAYFAKIWFDRYLVRMQQTDMKNVPETR